MTAHAYAMLDAFVYGFVIQEASIPASGDAVAEIAEGMIDEQFAQCFPALHAFTVNHVLQHGYDFRAEFDFWPRPDPRPAGSLRRPTLIPRGPISGSSRMSVG